MKDSHIEWCDHTFNPWEGCTKVSPGCANCYAEARNHRFGLDNWGKDKPRRRTKTWGEPVKWNRNEDTNVVSHDEFVSPKRPRVFCASLADWLDDEVPIEWLADLLKLIHDTPNLDWLLLTKRPENFAPRLHDIDRLLHGPTTPEYAAFRCWLSNMRSGWHNVTYSAPDVGRENYWIGTSVEDQTRADERIPELLKIPARIRFLSCEPLLEKVVLPWVPDYTDTRREISQIEGIHWVICGGESGRGARIFDVDWARSLRDQCQSAGVPFFMKQFGSNVMGREMDKWVTRLSKKGGDMNEWPAELRIREFPTTTVPA